MAGGYNGIELVGAFSATVVSLNTIGHQPRQATETAFSIQRLHSSRDYDFDGAHVSRYIVHLRVFPRIGYSSQDFPFFAAKAHIYTRPTLCTLYRRLAFLVLKRPGRTIEQSCSHYILGRRSSRARSKDTFCILAGAKKEILITVFA